MSQQQIDSGEITRDESRLSYREYESGALYDRDASALYGQKLTTTMNSSSPSSGLAFGPGDGFTGALGIGLPDRRLEFNYNTINYLRDKCNFYYFV